MKALLEVSVNLRDLHRPALISSPPYPQPHPLHPPGSQWSELKTASASGAAPNMNSKGSEKKATSMSAQSTETP